MNFIQGSQIVSIINNKKYTNNSTTSTTPKNTIEILSIYAYPQDVIYDPIIPNVSLTYWKLTKSDSNPIKTPRRPVLYTNIEDCVCSDEQPISAQYIFDKKNNLWIEK